ncbi:MAG: ABC transporter ATP-binding protein, partial [Firmicutes bacterium]|nr:ABC transporter ATP-binding protein [Bacillota bacterium]
MAKSLIKAEGLRKTFQLSKKQQKINRSNATKKVAVDDVSFECFAGEIYGLLGPNGAGKTTVMRILSTLMKADEGDATIMGASVKDDPDAVRKSIAFLTTELKLDEFFTPNYLYDFYSNLHKIDEETRKTRKKMLFDKFGINKFAEVKVGEMSTGMKQKVSLVVALVHDPKVIIFDEPTNGLDVLTAKVVTDFLSELKSQDRCIIVSTHIFSLIEKVCDRIGIIINGKMVVDDTLKKVCDGKTLEDRFFEIYRETTGGIE